MNEVREWLKATVWFALVFFAAPWLAGMFAHVIYNGILDGWRAW